MSMPNAASFLLTVPCKNIENKALVKQAFQLRFIA